MYQVVSVRSDQATVTDVLPTAAERSLKRARDKHQTGAAGPPTLNKIETRLKNVLMIKSSGHPIIIKVAQTLFVGLIISCHSFRRRANVNPYPF